MALIDRLTLKMQETDGLLAQHTRHTLFVLRDDFYELIRLFISDDSLPDHVLDFIKHMPRPFSMPREEFRSEYLMAMREAFGYLKGVYECQYGPLIF